MTIHILAFVIYVELQLHWIIGAWNWREWIIFSAIRDDDYTHSNFLAKFADHVAHLVLNADFSVRNYVVYDVYIGISKTAIL